MMAAVISECGTYRYRLERDVTMVGHTIAYFGVNCSTADAHEDDATIRKLTGFTTRLGGSRFIVGNPFALRSTDVKALRTHSNPVGPHNFYYLKNIISEAQILMPCWGNISKVPSPLRRYVYELADMIIDSGRPVYVFGLTKSGDPKHPLMLGYNTNILPWGGYTND